jgi:hypothetical protein
MLVMAFVFKMVRFFLMMLAGNFVYCMTPLHTRVLGEENFMLTVLSFQ